MLKYAMLMFFELRKYATTPAPRMTRLLRGTGIGEGVEWVDELSKECLHTRILPAHMNTMMTAYGESGHLAQIPLAPRG
jgi:hypothetical protein